MSRKGLRGHLAAAGLLIALALAGPIASAGASFWMVGENLRWGTGSLASPKSVVAAWMKSAEHRHVMLTGTFREIGIGFAPGSPTGTDEAAAAIYTADFGFRH